MHCIRRAVFRAASSPTNTLVAKSRTLTTNTSTLLRTRQPTVLAQVAFRRFASDDASKAPESADNESSTVQAAIDSASEMASSAAESVSSAASSVGDVFSSDSSPASSRGDLPGFKARVTEANNAVYVGNLLFDVTADDLRREFAQFGNISSTTVIADARGLSKGFGYVAFENVETAQAAIDAKNQTIYEGRRMIVNFMAKKSRTTMSNPPSKTLFIGNLAFEMSDADLNKMFREIRNVIDVRVAIDRRTGQPRGFAHADFVDIESAGKGLEALQGREVYGRALRVDYSAEARDRTPSDRLRRSAQDASS